MDASGLSEDGNVYKAVNHDANFRLTRNNGDPKATLHDGYKKKEGLPAATEPGAFDDLDALVEFVVTADDAAFAAQIGDMIDVFDYESWWLLVTFVAADDSAGKNSYHYHAPGHRWQTAPWDFNASFGQTWTTERRAAGSVSNYEARNLLFERFLATPEIADELAMRYRDLLDGPYSVAAIDARIDAILAELGPSVARDEIRWRAAYETFDRWSGRTDFTTHAEEVQYIRDWVAARWQVLDARF
jgi:spore coat protein CotH